MRVDRFPEGCKEDQVLPGSAADQPTAIRTELQKQQYKAGRVQQLQQGLWTRC